MPKPPLPPQLDALLREPNPAVIATLTPDGSPHSVATWYLWEDGRALVNMDASRKRLAHMRSDPRVSLTVLSDTGHVTLSGRVVEIAEDAGMRNIDRLAQHYSGAPFYLRDSARYDAWIEVASWHAWGT
jgi:PPOX class probable F420-dependent enzyme